MAELKTKPSDKNPEDFLKAIEDEGKRKDAFRIMKLMEEITGASPVMWGSSIVGFGSYHYKYASGREADWMLTGFAPRKQNLTIYIMSGFKKYDSLMKNLGKYKTGKSCLYVNKLEDVNQDVLKELISESVAYMKHKKW